MVCSTAILTSSLALSLLRHSSSPSQSFVLSPFSLNTALSIVHDGASGTTQEELTNLLLNGCDPSDVTNFYSSLAFKISSDDQNGVTFNSANRFYVSDSISLKNDYQKHIEEKYKVKVENLNLRNKENAANTMNSFVNGATNGMIKDIFNANDISDDALAYLINAIYFHGKWKTSFNSKNTHPLPFKGHDGERKVDFMRLGEEKFRVKLDDIGTILIMPYQGERFNFFFLMPNETSNLEKMRNELTGENLLDVLRDAEINEVTITVPKFKFESTIDGIQLLQKLGVKSLFSNGANLSKVSSTPLKVSKVFHKAVIEMDEQGTEAAAATYLEITNYSARISEPLRIVIDRPFLCGIMRGEDILFLGQYV